MDAPAAFKGTFSDIKFLKGRRVCQVVIETPLEEASRIVGVFGAPNPAEEVWVGFTRLQDGKAGPVLPDHRHPPPDEPPKPKPERSPAVRQAGIVCQEPEFWKFVRSEHGWPGFGGSEDAAWFVRQHCGVASRRDITSGSPAEKAWNSLFLEYGAWRARHKSFGASFDPSTPSGRSA
jgi:hypothetical protein